VPCARAQSEEVARTRSRRRSAEGMPSPRQLITRTPHPTPPPSAYWQQRSVSHSPHFLHLRLEPFFSTPLLDFVALCMILLSWAFGSVLGLGLVVRPVLFCPTRSQLVVQHCTWDRTPNLDESQQATLRHARGPRVLKIVF